MNDTVTTKFTEQTGDVMASYNNYSFRATTFLITLIAAIKKLIARYHVINAYEGQRARDLPLPWIEKHRKHMPLCKFQIQIQLLYDRISSS